MDGQIATKRNTFLITLGLLISSCSSGCSLLGIPSYRNSESSCSQPCPSGPLPPLPSCLAGWQEQQELPDAPEFPRFHPLPTRPMFTPQGDIYPHQ